MSDNTTIQSPSTPGDVISTEDIGGGVKLPRSKIALGAHGVDGGNVTTGNPFPVTITAAMPAGANVLGGTQDAGPAQAMSFGVSGATFTSPNQSSAAAAVTDAPTSGQKLVITDLEVSVDTAMAVTFTEQNLGTVVGKYYLDSNTTVQITPRGKKKLTGANNKLMVQTSTLGNIAVTAHYYSEA